MTSPRPLSPAIHVARQLAIAIACTAVSLGVALIIRGRSDPMALLLLGVIVANWIGGSRAGFTAAAFSFAAMDFFFLPPLYTFSLDRSAAAAFSEFALALGVVGWMNKSRGHSNQGGREEPGFVADSHVQRLERSRADEELRRSEAYLAEGQRLSHTGSWAFKVPSGERFWSREVFRIYGFDPAGPPPTIDQLRDRWHPEDRERADAMIERTIRERSDLETEFRLLMPDGAIKYLHTVGHPVLNEAGEVVEITGTVMDVTARKLAERRLRQAIRARYAAVLAERTRVAREMHDGLLQDAMGIALHLRAVLPDVRAASEAAANALLPVVDLAEKTTEEARQAIMGMRPSAAEEDIVGAVERAVRRAAAHTPLSLSVAVTGEVRPIRPHIQDAVVRIVQEAATNVARHAQARTVQLAVSFGPRGLRVGIVDDGRGFDLGEHPGGSPGHFGLIGMRERADELRGTLDVMSVPGAGTTVTLKVPYRS